MRDREGGKSDPIRQTEVPLKTQLLQCVDFQRSSVFQARCILCVVSKVHDMYVLKILNRCKSRTKVPVCG